MTMTFSCTLTCARCKTALTFENERPAWKTYDYRVEQPDECEKSARFVAEHVDDEDMADFPALAPWRDAWHAAGGPAYVDRYDYSGPFGGIRRLTLVIPDPYRYVDCPVCDEHVIEPVQER